MTKHAITVEIDEGQLSQYADSHLALLWHVAQANPASFADKSAGELVERISREIVTRWLRATPAELWHHQGRHYSHHWLTKFAKYVPGTPDARDPEWHNGTWVPREPDEVTAKLAEADGVEA